MEKLLIMIAESAWLLFPGYVANMAPIWFQRVPILNIPVDFGKTLRGKPLFGSHKTYRGFFFGVACALAFTVLQRELFGLSEWVRNISLVNYQTTSIVLLGFLLGFGALIGDLIKSFFKRRIGVASGKSWFPYDQLDYVIGMIVFLLPLYQPDPVHFIVMVISSIILHVVVSYIGYLLNMKQDKI